MRIIANPPIGIYDNEKTEIKHTSFLFLLDTLARYKSKREEIVFPGNSFNVFGKKIRKWYPKKLPKISKLREKVNEIISLDEEKKKINLISLDKLLDIDSECTKGILKDFEKLYNDDYIFKKFNSYYMDCPKIKKKFNLEGYLKNIFIHPNKAREELNVMIEKNMNIPLKITRDTYSVKNPLEGENIGPLFILSNLWDHKYPNAKFSMACSNNVLLKYIFLRFISKIALKKDPCFDELIVWPRVNFENEDNFWKLNNFTKEPYSIDMLRCTLLAHYPTQDTKVLVQKSKFIGSRNLVYLVLNLRKILRNNDSGIRENIYPEYDFDMTNLKYPKVLQKLEEKFRQISKKINYYKNNGRLDKNKKELLPTYLDLVDKISPFMPASSKLIYKEFENVI